MIDIREFTPLEEPRPAPAEQPERCEALERSRGSDAERRLREELERSRQREAQLVKDFRNYRRHAEQALADAENRARLELLGELGEVVRLLEVAGDAADQDPDSVRRGIELVARNLEKVFQEYGLERIPTTGARFDPELHEAVLTETRPGFSRGTVTREVCPGFRTDQGVVLAAKVSVAA
jgi:molecular chaperone GrpE